MFSPDCGEGAEAAGSLDIADKADSDHWGSFDDGDSLNNLFLVELGTGSVEVSDDGGHTSLVAYNVLSTNPSDFTNYSDISMLSH